MCVRRISLGGEGNALYSVFSSLIIDAFAAAGSQLNKSLVTEINEYFLFHGTKQTGLKSIEDHGLDSRLSSNAMFGSGVYFAESSTKADQYAGDSEFAF